MNWLEKIAITSFDNEMQQLLKDEGVDKIMDNKAIDETPNMNRKRSVSKYKPGSNVGITDLYNPTESESEYGQAV
jgi:hypothetical protein